MTTEPRCGDDDAPDPNVTVPPADDGSSPAANLVAAFGDMPGQSTSETLLGTEVGGVRIVRIIADGGMGRVYEGRQRKPRRPVAVKVIKPGVTTPAMLKRFEYEAQVLGRLRHPGIAHIHSVGTHMVRGQAVPYFVMEYIPNATSLTQYAEQHKLSTQDRLQLFCKVCEAVAHGHQKGVIHRDLKPGNVLVDSSGQPKVIDFGVAKSTDSDMALTTMQTDVGALIGTLQYMSPEQFAADPNDLDVRLDVYALGVILYELLTGRQPYEVSGRSIVDVARVVQEVEPTPISSLNKSLGRDVAVIAGTCLQKNRAHRYVSAAELAADVSRYLAGEPIMAAPPSLLGAVIRIGRRHKTAAAAVAGIAASLLIAMVGISVFAIRAERARIEADRERNIAMLASKAEAEQRNVAEESLAAVNAESTKAKRRLYFAMLYKLDMALDQSERSFASEFLRAAETAYHDAYGEDRVEPIEIACLKPAVDEAIVVLEGHASGVASLALSSDGTRLATGGGNEAGWGAEMARLWDVATGRLLATLSGHSGMIRRIVFSPDGGRLATVSKDGTARLWNVATGQSLAVLQAPQSGMGEIAFSPDGMQLASGSYDGTIRLWDASSGGMRAVLMGHKARITCVAFSPDGTKLATGGADNTARLWSASTGGSLAELTGADGQNTTYLVFSPDGTWLATGSDHGTVLLWEVASGALRAELKGHKQSISCLAFSPDGTLLASGSGDGAGRIWDVATAESLVVLNGHSTDIASLAFDLNGKRLATAGGGDDAVRLWDVVTGEIVAVFEGHRQRINALAFSPDGTRLVTASDDGTARFWDVTAVDSLAVLLGNQANCAPVAFSPDGLRLATGGGDNATRLWDVATGELLAVLRSTVGGGGETPCLAFTQDGTCLATGSTDGMARLWDAATGELRAVLKGHRLGITCLALSIDGTRLATGSVDGTARLWNVSTGDPLVVLEGHQRWITSLAFSPDGTQLVTGSDDATARLWDVAKGESLATVEGHTARVSSVAFSPDNARLATGSYDGTARLYDVSRGERHTLLQDSVGWIMSVAFSPDGTLLATGSQDGTARLWDVATGKLRAKLRGHEQAVASLAFAPDGTRLATVSNDGTLRLWDVAAGESLAVLEGHGDRIMAVAFSPDGARLATGSSDHSARLWGISNAEIHRNRLATAVARKRLAPEVAAWFTGDLITTKSRLIAANATMSAEDWHEAANLVLARASGLDAERPAAKR